MHASFTWWIWGIFPNEREEEGECLFEVVGSWGREGVRTWLTFRTGGFNCQMTDLLWSTRPGCIHRVVPSGSSFRLGPLTWWWCAAAAAAAAAACSCPGCSPNISEPGPPRAAAAAAVGPAGPYNLRPHAVTGSKSGPGGRGKPGHGEAVVQRVFSFKGVEGGAEGRRGCSYSPSGSNQQSLETDCQCFSGRKRVRGSLQRHRSRHMDGEEQETPVEARECCECPSWRPTERNWPTAALGTFGLHPLAGTPPGTPPRPIVDYPRRQSQTEWRH